MQRLNPKKQRQFKFPRHFWRWFSGILIVFIIFGTVILTISKHPNNVAKNQATQIAQKYAHLKTTAAFYSYRREQVYYTVAGTTNANKRVLVVIPEKGGDVRVLNAKDGISANTALTHIWNDQSPRKVLHIGLGYFNNKPVWEVTYQSKNGNLNYTLMAFKNGKVVQTINNI